MLMREGNLNKTSWRKFLNDASLGCQFIASSFDKNISHVLAALDQIKDEYKCNRFYVSGVKSLKFEIPETKQFSWLDKKGTVFKYYVNENSFYVIQNTHNIIVYRVFK